MEIIKRLLLIGFFLVIGCPLALSSGFGKPVSGSGDMQKTTYDSDNNGKVDDTDKIGTLTNTKWCTSNGTTVACTSNAPVLTESDPKIGTLTNTKWCTSDGSVVNCTENTPSGGSSQWTTSGSDIYYNSGNVSIGTTTPDTKVRGLHIESSTSPVRVKLGASNSGAGFWLSSFGDGSTQQTWLAQNAFWSTGGGFEMEDSSQSAERLVFDGTNHTMGFSFTAPGNAAYWNPVFIRMVGGPDLQMGFYTTGPAYPIDAARVMRTQVDTYLATESGNVGIGTTSPAYLLDVDGATRSTDYYSGDGTQGMTNSTSFWMCSAADCSTKCQAIIKDGLITACT